MTEVYESRFERVAKEEGISGGEQKGKLEMARNLLAHGVSLDIISKSSGLSASEINALVN